MAVTKIGERWQARKGSTGEDGVRTLSREWWVETNNVLDGVPVVVDAVIFYYPSAMLYASHPDWLSALCRKLDAEPNGGPRKWLVKAEYSSAPFTRGASGDGSGTAGNPSEPSAANSNSTPADQRAPTLTVARKEVTKVLEKDVVTGKRIVNTVGDPFDPLPEVFRSNHVITAKFFRTPAQLGWATRSQWMDSINETAVTILGRTYPARTLRCTAYDLDTTWETGPLGMAFFFSINFQAEYDRDGWQPKILNTGRRKRGATTSDPITAIVDANGQPVADPVPLTAAGVPVPPGTDPDDYHYVQPKGYVEKEWNGTGGSWTGTGGILA